jgi:myo-inositol 2-dehydrogenase/D-chiro-inositol 1-dehydrogenase
MRIGVIGVGRIGAFHAGILRDVEGVGSVLATDPDANRLSAVGERLGIDTTSEIDTLLDAVDAIVIAAPTSVHAELIGRGVAAELPTFCEKPISLDLVSSRAAVEVVGDSDVPVQMGFQRRFDPGYTAAAALVAEGAIGNLYAVRMALHDPAPPHHGYIPHSGGIFRDACIHDFDSARFVTGREIVEVYADGSVIGFPVFEEHADVDTAVATLRFEGGTLGVLSVARHDPLGYDVRMEVFGSKDSVAVGWDDRTPLRSVEPGVVPSPEPAYASFQERFRTAYEAEIAAFVDVAAGKRPSPCTVDDAHQALRVAVACDRSRAERRPVALEEVA